MSPRINPLAGKPAPAASLVNIPRLITAYYSERPDPEVPAQRVAFGTSGHRGSSFDVGFNEAHVLSISQAICEYRKQQGIDGPLFLGIDTHALSQPAFESALEVLAANGVDTRKIQMLGSGLWEDPQIFSSAVQEGAWYAGPDATGFRNFSARYRSRYNTDPVRTATLAVLRTLEPDSPLSPIRAALASKFPDMRKAAVEALFNVTVTAVNTMVVKGKVKKWKGAPYTRSDMKKAIVTLADGQSIDVATGL